MVADTPADHWAALMQRRQCIIKCSCQSGQGKVACGGSRMPASKTVMSYKCCDLVLGTSALQSTYVAL